jgi:aminoglycoside phosphotransferase (APT) family kinase protein
MADDEIPLRGGRVTVGVVRVGATVRRPLGPHSPFVHRLLRHLESLGVEGVPRFLGIDTAGRETLTFIAGQVPSELGRFSDAQLAAAARLLRTLHDAGSEGDLKGQHETVCHGDPSPCNYVFVDEVPVAIIDFDAAHPGTRWHDVAYASWLWLSIGDDRLSPREQGQRLRVFVDAYGGLNGRDAVPAVLSLQAESSQRADAPAAVRQWAQGCRAWLERHLDEVNAGMV